MSSEISKKLALGPFGCQNLPKSVPGPPPESQKGSQRGQKRTFLRLRIESKFALIYGAEQVGDLEAHKLEKRTLGTSKIIEINLRSCEFQGFALFSHGSHVNQCSISAKGKCWEPFCNHFDDS